MDTQKGVLMAREIAAQGSSQAMSEGAITLQDSAPGIVRVLCVSGNVEVGNIEVLQGQISMDGVVNFCVLYVPAEGGDVQSVEASAPFVHTIEAPGAQPLMIPHITAFLRETGYSLQGERTVLLSAIVEVQYVLETVMQIPYLEDVEGIENLQTQNGQISSCAPLPQIKGNILIREEMELTAREPTIVEILCNMPQVRILSTKAMEGKLAIQGELLLTTLYTTMDDAGGLWRTYNAFPFEYLMEVENMPENANYIATGQPRDLMVEMRADEEGENRILIVECVVALTVQGEIQQTACAVLDAYSTSQQVDVRFQTVHLPLPAQYAMVSQTLKETISLEEGLPPIGTPLVLQAMPILAKVTPIKGGVLAEGVVECCLIYCAEDETYPLFSASNTLPFSVELMLDHINEQTELFVTVMCDEAYAMSGNGTTADARIMLTFNVLALNDAKIQLAAAVEDLGALPPADSCAVVLYFVKPGDTVWDVARRFNTTPAVMSQLNTQITDSAQALNPGDKILLYRQYQVPKQKVN